MKFTITILIILALVIVPLIFFVKRIGGKKKAKAKTEHQENRPIVKKQQESKRQNDFFTRAKNLNITSFNPCTITGIFHHPAYGKTFLLKDGQWIYKGAVTKLGFVRDLYFNYFRVFDHEGVEHFYFHQEQIEPMREVVK